MDWQDEGIVLSVRSHGETSAIIELLTPGHGRHLGLVHGGRSRKIRPVLQAGNKVSAVWRARLADHLGSYRVDLLRARAAFIMEDAASLAALGALTELCRLLAEREPHPRIYSALDILLDILADDHDIRETARLILKFELGLLDEFGFGLDLSNCAATGEADDLIYVSPNTGRAVSRAAGEPYKAKLLTLPDFLLTADQAPAGVADLQDGFTLTGHFLSRNLFAPEGRALPEARSRFLHRLARAAEKKPD